MKKSIYVLLGLAVILVAAYFLLSYSEQRAMAPHSAANFVGADSGLVNKIVIKRLGETVELQRAGEGWTVNDAGKQQRAEKNVVDQIANVAHNLTVGDIISSNSEKQMLFQVDTLLGKTVDFYRDDQSLGTVIVGKAGSDFRSTYVRKPGSDDVFLAMTPLTRLVEKNARGFRDKIVAPFDTSRVALISVKSKDFEYSLVKVDSVWNINSAKEGTFIADHNKAMQTVGMLGNLRVSDFVSDAERDTVNFAAATDLVTVNMLDGTSIGLALVPKSAEAKDYYLKYSNLEDLFVVYEGTRSSLMKKPEDYKPGA